MLHIITFLNGTDSKSILSLIGEYFFELDNTSVLPGYPKLIEDVWGMSGPIDAAFTRINCQGKSYIFKVDILHDFLSGKGHGGPTLTRFKHIVPFYYSNCFVFITYAPSGEQVLEV